MVSTSPSIGSIITKSKEEVLARLELAIISSIKPAADQSKKDLRNNFEGLLSDLALIISSFNDITNPRLKEISCIEHGEGRSFLRGYSILDVLHEYSLLRRIVFEVIESEAELRKDQRDILLNVIDLASRIASGAFLQKKTQIDRDARADAEVKTANAIDESVRLREQHNISRQEVYNLTAEKEEKNTFIAMLSHDLRNPLASVKMAFELLIAGLPADRQDKRIIGIIERNLKRSEEMIADLLDANRIQAGYKLPLEIAHCDLAAIARETVHDLISMYGNCLILSVEDSISGHWNPSRLRRIIENLASNAVKHGNKNSNITIKITQDKESVTLSVHNFGPPIPLSEQKTLFDQFFRAKAASTSLDKSWGLGLTMVRGVVEAHGGTVWVESTEENGTIFIVKLPKDSRPFQQSIKK